MLAKRSLPLDYDAQNESTGDSFGRVYRPDAGLARTSVELLLSAGVSQSPCCR